MFYFVDSPDDMIYNYQKLVKIKLKSSLEIFLGHRMPSNFN